MTFIAVGINYNTAPVAIRERLAFPADTLSSSLLQLSQVQDIHGAAILSTCNRTELYCTTPTSNQDNLISWIAHTKNIEPHTLQPYLYSHTDRSVCRHMFRVACGLDSMMLGEPQILGQMKTAYQAAYAAGTLGKQLGRLFQHTFSTASKVRTDTKIGHGAISVAFAAVKLAVDKAQGINGTLGNQTVLLIGAGETIELIARHLNQHGVKRILIANRTYHKAHDLAVSP
jgi:glutamyl-tRNA reductase